MTGPLHRVALLGLLFCVHVFAQDRLLARNTDDPTTSAPVEMLNLNGGPPTDEYGRASQLYLKGRYVEAAAEYERACDQFVAKACTDLGVMYRRGEGVKRNYPRAGELSLRGCDLGNALGCTNLGIMYWSNVLAKNDQRAAELFQRACDGGDSNGCRCLGFLYENGQGVAKDPIRAESFYQRAREHRFPFRVQEDLILIETEINAAHVTLVVDTGGTTVFGAKFLPTVTPDDPPTSTLESMHGSSQVYPITVTWNFDGTPKKLPAFAGDVKLPLGTDGIFGADVLRTFGSVRFDFRNSQLILEDR